MPIKILSPQLANQIAAGEVVERPASVVKELVENSLDAGATRIQVDINNGGASLIRIRDNGLGIAKEELSLALARHATSKIADLEDLEAILSLGFRGEALASISSVSRLTLTSRTAEQSEAWQVYAQGREMETHIQPASHPQGTTVEVANLFFNTPARRKFLRSEKTEFAHIDEVIRRIALAKSHIAFTLTHNGKIVRQYRAAQTPEQKLKRVAAICGEDFVQNALQIEWKHDDLHLYGWLAVPQFARNQNDLAYCYINGRMVRDKIVNHAIRQAYAEHLSNEQYPVYVLFLDLNPNEVDVNVHPTKHEVRFQQQRLVHDFILQGISNALQSESALPFATANQIKEPASNWSFQPNRAAAGQNIFTNESRAENPIAAERAGQNKKLFQNAPLFSGSNSPNQSTQPAWQRSQTLVSKGERAAYDLLMGGGRENAPNDLSKNDLAQNNSTQIEPPAIPEAADLPRSFSANPPLNAPVSTCLRSLAIIEQRALLLQQNEQFYLLDLGKLQQLKLRAQLRQNPASQALLIPLTLRLNEQQNARWQQQKDWFAQCGFALSENHGKLQLDKVPSALRQQNLQQLIVSQLEKEHLDFEKFLQTLCAQIPAQTINVLADGVNLLNETERLLNQQNSNQLADLLRPINWQPLLENL